MWMVPKRNVENLQASRNVAGTFTRCSDEISYKEGGSLGELACRIPEPDIAPRLCTWRCKYQRQEGPTPAHAGFTAFPRGYSTLF